MVSLDFLSTNNKTLFLAYDQGMEHGPSDFNDENIDPQFILDIGVKGGFNAVIFQKGIAEKYYRLELKETLPLIVKLNGKTNLVKDEDPYSPLLCTVDEALRLGASAVGYTVYVGSEYEGKMTQEFASVIRDAHAKGIPVLGWMYPRGKNIPNPNDGDIIAYAARMGLEIGADIVKVNYPGSKEALEKVIDAAGKTKVVVSGGKKDEESDFLSLVKIVAQTKAFGMAVGRNIWQHTDPLGITQDIKKELFV